MGKYKVLIKASAAREIENLPSKKDRQRVVRRIQALAQEPRPPGCQKLSSQEKYRVRQGVYRIVYAIEDDLLIVQVVKVGHRKEGYRR